MATTEFDQGTPSPRGGAPAPPTPGDGGRNGAVGGLRAVAALAILLFHVAAMSNFTTTGGLAGALTARLDVAVSIFFAISGLLLFRPWARRTLLGASVPRTGVYLWRRAVRILPAYWITAVVAMIALAEPAGYSAGQWVQMLLLVQIYDPAPAWPNGGLGPTALGQIWSLAVEAAFYLALPALAWAMHRYGRRERHGVASLDMRATRMLIFLIPVGLASFALAVVMHVPERIFWIQFLLPHYLIFFAIGMGLALLLTWAEGDSPGAARARQLRDMIASSAGTCLLTAGLAYWLLMTPVVGRFGDPFTTLRDEELRILLHAVITVLIVAPVACRAPSLTHLLGSRPMAFLGEISYGIFLWQFVVMELVYRVTGMHYFGGGFLPLLALSLPGTVVVATVTHYLVERPLSRLRGAPSAEPAAAPNVPTEPNTTEPNTTARPVAPEVVVPEAAVPEAAPPPPAPVPLPRTAPVEKVAETVTEEEARPRRRAADPEHQNALDGVRAIAALAVLLYHVSGKTGVVDGWGAWVLSRGDVGVAIFFTLSGLLLYRPWARAALDAGDRPETRAYLWRRAFRILPAYWLVAAVALIFFNPAHNASQWVWAKWLLLLQVYDVSAWWGGVEGRGLEHMWSLGVEVAFYVTLPLIAAALTWAATLGGARDTTTRALRLFAGLGVMVLISVGVTVAAHQPGTPGEVNMLLPRYFMWFAPGMALAVLSAWSRSGDASAAGVREFCRRVAGLPILSWTLAAIAFAIGCTPLIGPPHLSALPVFEGTVKSVLWGAVGLFLVAPSAFATGFRGLTNRVFGNVVLRYLGKISYGIFLWQFVVIYGYYALSGSAVYAGGDFWEVLAIALTGILILSALTYHLIEEPFHRLGRQLGTRPGAGSAPASARPVP